MGRALLALLLLLGVAWAQPEVPDGGVFVPATEDEDQSPSSAVLISRLKSGTMRFVI